LVGVILSSEIRKWIFTLIENSDGKPHHNDGFFLVLVYASVLCFKISSIAALRTIYFEKDLLEVAITFALFGSGLIGARLTLPLFNRSAVKEQIDDLIKR
jgi:hypothetical protein